MPTAAEKRAQQRAAEKQAQQRAAQVAALNASKVAPTTGGIRPNYDPYADPFNTELRRGAADLAPTTGGVVPTFEQFGNQLDDFNAKLKAVQDQMKPVATAVQTAYTAQTDPYAAVLAAQRQSAFATFQNQLQAWGLGGLADWAKALYQSENAPTSFDEFYLQMKQQPIYIERFGKTNDMRIKQGLPALSEASIMGLESQYQKTMKAYGLPASFYDNPEDYRNFIANDLSASEVADRVQAAASFVKAKDPQVRQQLSAFYGIGDGALIAAELDPKRGQQIIEQLASKNTAMIAAGTAGLGLGETNQALGMGAGTKSFAEQAQGFAQAAAVGQQGQQLSQIYGDTYGVQDATQEAFNGPGAYQAQQKRKRLGQQEEATFGGGSGVERGSLATGDLAGRL